MIAAPSSSPAAVTLGTVVADRLGLGWVVHHDPYGLGLDAMAGLAVRRNPKRAHLIVSRVLGKHIAAPPAALRAAGLLLAGLVQQAFTGDRLPELAGDLVTDPRRSQAVAGLAEGTLAGAPVVLGYCETATGLGHTVADAFTDATYVHTTRRPDPARPTLAGFNEEHSHAVAHSLQPAAGLLDNDRTLVLVDDELTTGTTVLNTIAALHAQQPRLHYVVAALMDLRSEAARDAFATRARGLGVQLQVVALIDGTLELPDDILERAAPLRQEAVVHPAPQPAGRAQVVQHDGSWPAAVPTGGRHGYTAADRGPFADAIAAVGSGLLDSILATPSSPGPILVLGTEELMYAPVRLAHWLELALHARGVETAVVVQSTTRSPVLAIDQPGYAIRRSLTFPSPDDPGRDSYLYNVVDPAWPAWDTTPYTDIVVVTEDPPVACAPLVRALLPWASSAVHLLPLCLERT